MLLSVQPIKLVCFNLISHAYLIDNDAKYGPHGHLQMTAAVTGWDEMAHYIRPLIHGYPGLTLSKKHEYVFPYLITSEPFTW